jgi:hypothetical protein
VLQKAMPALHPKADMCGTLAHVRYGPEADIHELSGTAPLAVKAGCFLIARIEPISLIQRCDERDHICTFGVNWSR